MIRRFTQPNKNKWRQRYH